MSYTGPERRIHKVFVTRNTEYHVRRNTCVGVRDRESGSWLRAHLALSRHLCGALRFSDGGVTPNAGTPRVGESLYFQSSGQDLVTSVVTAVVRPKRNVVEAYQH